MRPLSNFWFLALLFSYAVAETRQAQLILSNADVSPDGLSRRAIVVNGMTPGPMLTANKGDGFQINVVNNLTDLGMETATSVHWHGIFQRHTNAYDGTSFVTQCPLTPGHSFLYNFDLGNQTGTYWYHSHHDLQYCDGLRGPLIIYDQYDPYLDMYDVDDSSTILTMFDWFHFDAKDAFYSNPSAIIFNGKGRYPGGPNVPLSVTNVEQGKRYRLRLINMSCKAWINFSIDNHNFTIIEADGNAVIPHDVDSMWIHAGQRYSIVLEASQVVDNYWIHAMPGNYDSNFTNGLNSAILKYKGASDAEPKDRNWTLVNPLNEYDLLARDSASVPGEPFPGGADVSLNLVTSFDEPTVVHFINGVQYHSPDVPTLLQIMSGVQGIDLAPQGSVYVLPPNKSIEISFPAFNVPKPHPWHLHGHNFHVVRSAGSFLYNYVNPLKRDTVSMGDMAANDNTTIRFVTDNPGPWFLHCHIDFHLVKGMAVVLAEDPQGTVAANSVDKQWSDLCPVWNQTLAKGTEDVVVT